MNTEPYTLDRVKRLAKEFMEREYPDEAPYFSIAWETFEKALQGRKATVRDLRGPTVRDLRPIVRLERDDTIMAPKVIRAFHMLFTMMEQKIEPEPSESIKREMLEFLSEKTFSLEFSMDIVDFFMENRNNLWNSER